jgi:hypothetical protein
MPNGRNFWGRVRWSLNRGGFDLQHDVRMKKATDLEQRGRGFATRRVKARPSHRSRSQKLIYVSYVIVQARYLLQTHTRFRQHRLEIIDRLEHLFGEVPGMKGLALSINGRLSRTEQ